MSDHDVGLLWIALLGAIVLGFVSFDVVKLQQHELVVRSVQLAVCEGTKR